MDWNRLVDFVQGLLTSWPSVTLVLGTIFLFRYREVVNGALARIKKVGVTGAEFVEIQQTAAITSDTGSLAGIAPPTAHQHGAIVPNPQELAIFLSKSEGIVRPDHDAEIRAEAYSRFPDQGDREVALIRNSSLTITLYAFEQIRNTLWASQLEIVRAASQGGMEVEQARSKYAAIQAVHSSVADYSFESYFGFLRVTDLVSQEGTRIEITEKGRRFLFWFDRLDNPRPGNLNL